MENTGYIALSRQMAMSRQMDVIANNMANMNTPAYQGESMMFVEYLQKTPNGEQTSFVQDIALVRNLTEGQKISTKNDLDLAIAGKGFFEIETELGTRYTRNGTFQLNADGELVTSQGDKVLGEDDQPIVFPPGTGRITIARDGTTSTENGQIGRLRVVRFENQQALIKGANGLYEADGQQPEKAEDAEVLQGMIEGSNVQGITEMTSLINAARSYASAAKIVKDEHERLRRAIQTLGAAPRG